MGMGGQKAQPLGSQGNAWNGVATGTNTNSTAIYVGSCAWVSAFGHVSGAATITVYYSFDNTNWYASTNKVTTAGAADFALDFTTAAPYIALQSSAGVTATATICGKDA